jgi:hypothetical protein
MSLVTGSTWDSEGGRWVVHLKSSAKDRGGSGTAVGAGNGGDLFRSFGAVRRLSAHLTAHP